MTLFRQCLRGCLSLDVNHRNAKTSSDSGLGEGSGVRDLGSGKDSQGSFRGTCSFGVSQAVQSTPVAEGISCTGKALPVPGHAGCSVDILLIKLGNFLTSTSPLSAETCEFSYLMPKQN